MASVIDLADRAPDLLARYCSPASMYAWPHYDIDRTPSELTPTDLLAPAMLSYPIRRDYFEPMLQRSGEPNPYARLHEAMQRVIEDADAADFAFDEVPMNELANRDRPGWGCVLEAFDATSGCRGITPVAVSKILHRKRPRLVPLIDSRVHGFYGTRTTGELIERIHGDLTTHAALLGKWRDPYTLRNGTKMSPLRALDIVIWMRNEQT